MTTERKTHPHLLLPLILAGFLAMPSPEPAAAQVVILSPSTQEWTAGAGDGYEGRIRIRNPTAEPAELRLGQSDYHFSADGTNRFGDPDSEPRSNASWITLSATDIILAPGEEAELGYQLRVPDGDDAELQGTYWSVIFVEWIPPGDPESTLSGEGDDEERLTIRTRIRHAIQVATHIGGTGRADLAFESPGLEHGEDGGVEFSVVVENRGSTGYRPNVSAAVFDADGNEVRTAEEARGLLYPGTSLRQRFSLGSLPSGTYTVLLLADAGADEVFGAQYALEL